MTMHSSELLARLSDEELLVIDCRTPDDWDLVDIHIPGALRMSLAELSDGVHALPDDELIVVVGWANDETDARRACRMLRLNGRDAVCLVGGLRGWITAGYPTERHAKSHAHGSGDLAAR
jgi:rhodanese-related sulfurtransferase